MNFLLHNSRRYFLFGRKLSLQTMYNFVFLAGIALLIWISSPIFLNYIKFRKSPSLQFHDSFSTDCHESSYKDEFGNCLNLSNGGDDARKPEFSSHEVRNVLNQVSSLTGIDNKLNINEIPKESSVDAEKNLPFVTADFVNKNYDNQKYDGLANANNNNNNKAYKRPGLLRSPPYKKRQMHPPQDLMYNLRRIQFEKAELRKKIPLIFVGGMPRSGTTLMRAILDAHPFVQCGEETRVIPRILFMRKNWANSKVESTRLEEARMTDKILNAAIGDFILSILSERNYDTPNLQTKIKSHLNFSAEEASSFKNSPLKDPNNLPMHEFRPTNIAPTNNIFNRTPSNVVENRPYYDNDYELPLVKRRRDHTSSDLEEIADLNNNNKINDFSKSNDNNKRTSSVEGDDKSSLASKIIRNIRRRDLIHRAGDILDTEAAAPFIKVQSKFVEKLPLSPITENDYIQDNHGDINEAPDAVDSSEFDRDVLFSENLELEDSSLTKKRLCNKDPFVMKTADLVSGIFPNAKFVFMIRDGRAVVNSVVTRKVTITGWNVEDHKQSLTMWNNGISQMYDICHKLGPRICMPVHYEKLVLQPRNTIKDILNFLDLPWTSRVLNHNKLIGKPGGISISKLERSSDQVIKPINTEALDKWKENFPKNINVSVVAPMLIKLNYSVEGTSNYGTADPYVLKNDDKIQSNHEYYDEKIKNLNLGRIT